MATHGHYGDSDPGMYAADADPTRHMLEQRLAQVEELLGRHHSTPYKVAGMKAPAPPAPPLEEESGQPSFTTELLEHLERNHQTTNDLVEEIMRLRSVIAAERSDRRQEQERILKTLGSIIAQGEQAFPGRHPTTNVPPRW